jgi:signal transduction histidine kinase
MFGIRISLFTVLFVPYAGVAVSLLALGAAGAIIRAAPGASSILDPRTLPADVSGPLGSAVLAAAANTMPWPLVLLDYLVSALNLGAGLWLGWRLAHQRVARLLALGMVGAATSFNAHAHGALLSSSVTYTATLNDLHVGLHVVSGLAYLYALLVFPDGRLMPRCSAWLLATIGGAAVGSILVFHAEVLFFVVYFGFLIPVVGLSSLAFRRRLSADPLTRQQIGIVMWALGLVLTVALLLLACFLTPAAPRRDQVFPLTSEQVAYTTLELFSVLFALVPIALFVGIVRYHLFGVRLIARALVYGTLTVCILAVYGIIVGGVGLVSGTSNSAGVSLLACAAIALLFQPMRERLQRGAYRLVYGEGDEPYRILARLGARLEAALAPEAVLPTIVDTVRESLRLPYAAIVLAGAPDVGPAASSGRASDTPLRVPLSYQQELMGELLVAQRGPSEPFTRSERRLLEDLARHAGVATHAVQLTSDLQRAQRRLVHAVEEERRRLRRDLHDGLGPTLAGQVLRAGTARRLLSTDADGADALLAKLETDLKQAIGDLRAIVHNLRPPVLEQLGLAGAIESSVARLAASSGLVFELHLSCNGLCSLPAAAEVAAFRIVEEALANVVRHARAGKCEVRVAPGDTLDVEVVDDGVGLPDTLPKLGVGLASMRERAAELGGTCVIESPAAGGTRVVARLPLYGMCESRG